MNLDLAGKVALVTGSSRGIGKSIAKVLAAEGCRIALNGRNEASLLSAAEDIGGGSFIALGDVSLPDSAREVVTSVVQHFGQLDIVVANVGSGRSVQPGDENFAEWQRVFSVNLWSTTNIVEAACDNFVPGQGVIVCVSSICGLNVISGAPVPYSVAKAALHAYVKGIARPLGKKGIRINAIAPGNILFPGSVWDRKLQADRSAVESMLQTDVALARFGTAEEVANMVAFMASAKSGFATGGVWMLDGGQIR